ncbi:class F sortase [Cellulomonas phragmiteti]|nr:class F sortase [Cellulomonas phragmiteti]
MAASVPVRVQIPAIGVDAELMRLGLQADGTMEVPPGGFPAGWFDGAPTPGELGPAVIAGHVDWAGPGVFAELAQVSAGDEIRVVRTDGTAPVFVVTAVEEHPKDLFPSAAVYGDIEHAGLRLITCGGEWDPEVLHYRANVVVFAELVRPG